MADNPICFGDYVRRKDRANGITGKVDGLGEKVLVNWGTADGHVYLEEIPYDELEVIHRNPPEKN